MKNNGLLFNRYCFRRADLSLYPNSYDSIIEELSDSEKYSNA